MSNKKFGGSVNGKGYYIALILCAAAIGISGYLYYRNANDKQPQMQNPGAVTAPGKDVEAVATQPNATKPGASAPTEGSKPAGKPMKTVSPVKGETVAAYAMDSLTYNQTTRDWRVHNGMDIGAEAGTEVCSAAAGTVYTVYEDETMGTTVVIRHQGGYTTKYSSLDKAVSVSPGDKVEAGQTIGKVGRTALLESAIGEHVHFSVTKDDKPMDPAEFLDRE